jgi:hypothetical protein
MQKVLLLFLAFTLSTVLLAQPTQPGIDRLLVPVVNDNRLPVVMQRLSFCAVKILF